MELQSLSDFLKTPFASFDCLRMAKWLNDNDGVVQLGIFIVTILFAWASGIISALRHKPNFRISIISGPTFICTFPTGKKSGQHEIHRTAVALYLNIENMGHAASSIREVSVAYHFRLAPLSFQWVRYVIGWFWLKENTGALRDFQAAIGDNIKVFPFLLQRGLLSNDHAETFLAAGQATNGIVYFESPDCWGGAFPASKNGKVKIKVSIQDVYQNKYGASFEIPMVSLHEARKYNPSFGQTIAELRQEPLPFDLKNQPMQPS